MSYFSRRQTERRRVQLSADGEVFTFSIPLVRRKQKSNVLFGAVSNVIYVKFPLISSETAWTTREQRMISDLSACKLNVTDPILHCSCDISVSSCKQNWPNSSLNMCYHYEDDTHCWSVVFLYLAHYLTSKGKLPQNETILQLDSDADEIRRHFYYFLLKTWSSMILKIESQRFHLIEIKMFSFS